MTLLQGAADMRGQVAAAARENGEARGRGRRALGCLLSYCARVGPACYALVGLLARLQGLLLFSFLFFSVFFFFFLDLNSNLVWVFEFKFGLGI